MNAHAHTFVADGTTVSKPIATIVDRPCGWGKSSQLIGSFKKDKRYLLVLPTLDEINNRYLPETNALYGEGFFTAPTIDEKSTKYEHIEELLIEGRNIITTHALYTNIVMLAKDGLLRDYDVIIDEVLDCVKQYPGPKPDTWREIYKGKWADVDPDGKVIIKPEWTEKVEELDDALSVGFYKAARAGCLYLVKDRFWIWTLPKELFTLSKSVTIFTYLAEGTLLLPYLQKIGVQVEHDVDVDANEEMKRRCRELISLYDISSLNKVNLSDSKQDTYSYSSVEAKKVSSALSILKQRKMSEVSEASILITCKKRMWFRGGKEAPNPRTGPFSYQSKMFKGTNWIPNTTRGTNDYRHCTHLIYLYNQNPAPQVVDWLGLEGGYHAAADRFALAELIQWVFRSQIRDGKPITLYLAAPRMKTLLEKWMNS